MEPTEALASLEVGLRSLILECLGDDWLEASDAPDRTRLETWRDNEKRKRHGAVVSSNLLDYTMTPELGKLIFANWEAFSPVFGNPDRLKVLLGIVENMRNSVAHSRELLPFERELLSGVAGYVSNSLALHRGSLEGPGHFYPLIESVTDQLGNDLSMRSYGSISGPRLAVGDLVTLRAASTPTRGVELLWTLAVGKGVYIPNTYYPPRTEARGSAVTLVHRIDEDDVSEEFWIAVRLSTESRFHRYMESISDQYDDAVAFYYPIAPPFGV